MSWHRTWTARLRGLLRRGRRESEMNEEVGFHLDMQAGEYERRGMSPEQARQAARRRFGAVEQVKEEYRRQGGVPWLESFVRDLGYGLRMLRKSPLVTAVALVSLSLGLGASGAIFNVIDSLLLARLPVAEPDRLVVLKIQRPEEPAPRVSYPAFRMLQDDAAVFSGVIAFGRSNTSMLVRPLAAGTSAPAAGSGDPLGDWVDGAVVSGSYFPVLGVHAWLGRTLTPADDRVPGGHPVAMLSYSYWQRRFAGDPAVVGRALDVNGQALTVVGVTPPGFFGVSVGDAPGIFVPTSMQAAVRYVGNADIEDGGDQQKPWMEQPHIGWLYVMARLRPGVSAAQAAAVATVTYRRFAAANVDPKHPENLRQVPALRMRTEPGARGVSQLRGRDVSLPLAILMSAAVLLLLIACANTANLLLARAAARRREIAVRLSQGAGRARLVRQLLTESLLLAAIAGGCGLALARWGSVLLLRIAAGRSAGWPLDLSLGWRKLVFLSLACLGTALLFGLAPALQATRLDLVAALKVAVGSTGGGGRARVPLSKVLVILEVGLSLVLLVGAGLFVRSLRNLSQVDPGFQRSDLLLVRIHTQLLRFDAPRMIELDRRIQERVAALPGVRSASLSLHPPVSGSQRSSSVVIPAYTPRPGEDMDVSEMIVTPGYFATLGLPLREGRDFTAQDRAGAPKVVIVNETMARAYFRRGSPVGQRFGYGADKPRELEIVGVVRDARFYDLRVGAPPMMFFAVAQYEDPMLHDVEIRTAPGMAAGLLPQVRQALHEVEPELAIGSAGTMEQLLERSLAQDRAVARLTAFFGLVALLLSSIGLYGVISYGVALRRSEIGLRLALGAARGQVLGLVLRETLQLAAVGVALGLLGAFGATRLAASRLFGLSATDPATLGAAILVMAAVASLAGYAPARRAAGLDPLSALRSE
jgi:predicted permease